jgi:hypothetical protein
MKVAAVLLPNQLQRELDLPRGCCRRRQQTCDSGRSPAGIEDVIVRQYGHNGLIAIRRIRKRGAAQFATNVVW